MDWKEREKKYQQKKIFQQGMKSYMKSYDLMLDYLDTTREIGKYEYVM